MLHLLPGTQFGGVAHAAVVHGLVFLDQARFQQQGAELASGLDPFQAADVAGDVQVRRAGQGPLLPGLPAYFAARVSSPNSRSSSCAPWRAVAMSWASSS